ncbi:MAG: esterase-like activity of phytase family protein [Rhodospirillales bacterium]
MSNSIRHGTAIAAALVAAIGAAASSPAGAAGDRAFERIATVEVWRNDPAATRSKRRVAEIVDATPDGTTLVYTDSEGRQIGFYDITDPASPVGLGVFPVGGEPTSVATFARGGKVYALVAVNTSPSFTAPSGELLVVDITDPSGPALAMTLAMGGQPDSVAVSPNGTYAAVAIENERDEGLTDPRLRPNEGGLPQRPAGFLAVVDLSDWSVHEVDLRFLSRFGTRDPEPEFVAINADDIAAVTLQENNAVVLVDLRRKRVIRAFDAGAVKLRTIDTIGDDVIRLTDSARLFREPDAIAWVRDRFLATANEGDLRGGSRGFTIFDRFGRIAYESRESLEHLVVRHGHYPEGRSDAKGGEPEAVAWAEFDGDGYLFVGLERAGSVAVYRLDDPAAPAFVQLLPAGLRPEGVKAIPARDLLVVASERDRNPNRDDRISGFRAAITIYRLQDGPAAYPTVVSADAPTSLPGNADARRQSRLPIPWGALSGLAADREDSDRLYAVSDSFYAEAQIFVLDVRNRPAVIERAITLRDDAGDPYPGLDLEGLVQRSDGSFWVVSEGDGTQGDASRPVTTTNRLLEVAADGSVRRVIGLPAAVDALQIRFGFEGVAVTGTVGVDEKVHVAFQREWFADTSLTALETGARIGVYDPETDQWTFFLYPLDAPGPVFSNAWVGLSEIVALGPDTFAVVERDNLIGDEAADEGGIKQICTFSIAGLVPQPQGGVLPTVAKSAPCTDLKPVLRSFNGQMMDKVEGLTVATDGAVYIVTDNDGVDEHPGETQLIGLGDVAAVLPSP